MFTVKTPREAAKQYYIRNVSVPDISRKYENNVKKRFLFYIVL